VGRLAQARDVANQALALAEGQGDTRPAVAALLALAEVELRAENLDAAVAHFNRAQTLAQASEEVAADALAGVGLGRTLLRRGLAEEAALIVREQLSRLRAADIAEALALAQVAYGDALREKGEADPARQAYAAARKLYAGCESPLGEALALRAEAALLMDAPEIKAAAGNYARAIALVERVGDGLRESDERLSIFDSYAALYGEAIIVAARETNEARVTELAGRFVERVGRAGRAALSQQLRQAEQVISVRSPDMSKDEIERNKVIARTLANARKLIV
jgi:predicted negative regulator of RcsB-dependent stress response